MDLSAYRSGVNKPRAQRKRQQTTTAALVLVLAVWLRYGSNGIEDLAAAVGSWAGLIHIAHHYFRGK